MPPLSHTNTQRIREFLQLTGCVRSTLIRVIHSTSLIIIKICLVSLLYTISFVLLQFVVLCCAYSVIIQYPSVVSSVFQFLCCPLLCSSVTSLVSTATSRYCTVLIFSDIPNSCLFIYYSDFLGTSALIFSHSCKVENVFKFILVSQSVGRLIIRHLQLDSDSCFTHSSPFLGDVDDIGIE